jgi:hypothetical protein
MGMINIASFAMEEPLEYEKKSIAKMRANCDVVMTTWC